MITPTKTLLKNPRHLCRISLLLFAAATASPLQTSNAADPGSGTGDLDVVMNAVLSWQGIAVWFDPGNVWFGFFQAASSTFVFHWHHG